MSCLPPPAVVRRNPRFTQAQYEELRLMQMLTIAIIWAGVILLGTWALLS